MNLHQQFLTKNLCYVAAKTIKPCGIFVHSTGANNPNLNRYVAPDDGLLGPNIGYTHWNQPTPGGRKVCVHAMIGKLKNGAIGTYQTLPWNFKGWHSGVGPKGSANDMGYIGFEICEDDLNDRSYFEKVYQEAVELCIFLCKKYNFNPMEDIICHCEGFQKGIASNHADVMHWFPRYGKSMDTFRKDVQEGMAEKKIDNTADSYARAEITWALQNEVVKGDTTGDLRLHENITRQDVLVFIKRALDTLKK